jgi:type IV pilus assembly protein PilW
MKTTARLRPGSRERGMTLVELMVAMAIGLFLIGGALTMLAQSRSTYRASDSLARLQENARFALDTLEPDVRLVRYWGRTSEPLGIAVPAAMVVECNDGNDVRAWALDLGTAIDAQDDDYNLPCPAFRDAARTGSDVLILRHASGEAAAADAGQIQVISRLGGGELVNDGSGAVAPGEALHDVVVNAYYVSDESAFETGQAALRRLTLVKGGTLRDEEVIAGIENLQVQFGLDSNNDGAVERYVDAANPALTPDARIAAVRLWMLVAVPADDPAFSDSRSWQPADADLAPITPGTASYPANFRRMEVAKTIYLRNELL